MAKEQLDTPTSVCDLLIWQIADTAFPTGGFAHSGGLESAYHAGETTGPEELRDFAEASITQARLGVLPFVKAAHQDAAPLDELDALCNAFLVNQVANRASRALGRGLLYVASSCFHNAPFAALVSDWTTKEGPQHYAVAFGVMGRYLGISLPSTLRVALYTSIRDLVSSAIRLNLIGPHRAQTLLYELGPAIFQAADPEGVPTHEDAAQTAPMIDIFQNAHDGLYSRLFQS